MKYTILSPETEQLLATVNHADVAGKTSWEITFPGSKEPLKLDGIEVLLRDGVLELRWPGELGRREVFPAMTRAQDGSFIVATALGNIRLLPARGAASEAAGGARGGAKAVKSSMPGKVLKILCKVGDELASGQPMMIIEAMKMENEIRSPQAGVVEEIGVQPGQSIQTGDLLVKLGKKE